MGFSREQAVGTLRIADNDVAQAINLLLEGRGVEEESQPIGMDVESTTKTAESESTSTSEKSQEEKERENKLAKERELHQATENEILESVEDDVDAHLNVSLEEELAVLEEYKELLLQTASRS